MSSHYVSSNQRGNLFTNSSLGLSITLAIIIILPGMHILGNIGPIGNPVKTEEAAVTPPPPPDEPPKVEEEKKELEKPEDLKEPPPELSLIEIEKAIQVGNGNAMGDYSLRHYDHGIKGEDIENILEWDDLDKKPKPLFEVRPNYPYSLRQAQIKGYAIVEWIIDSNGKVLRAKCVKASHPEFAQPAIEAVMRSKFTPGRKNGENVSVRVRRTYDFSP